MQEVEIGNNVAVFGEVNKNRKIISIQNSDTGYSGKIFTIQYNDNSPNSTSSGHNLQLNLAANTSSPPALPTEGDE